MFEAYFNLTGTPFGRNVGVKELAKSESREELNSRLLHVARTRSFGVFTGDVGTGKTTAIRRFASELDKNRHLVLYISDSALTPRNFYWEALHQLGCTPRFYRGDAKRQLQKMLAELTDNEKKTPVIIVDEAHLLSREMLEEIRFLLNLNMDSYSALALILVGQSELKEMLRLQVYQAIAQRVDMRFHLCAMDRAETSEYIKRHLNAVKSPSDIFTQAALHLIHDCAGGLPRMVNKIAIACLMTGSNIGQMLIDDHIVRSVIANEFEA